MPAIPSYLTSDTAKQFYSDAVRHGLVGLAGILVARGYLHQGDVSNFIAAGMAVFVAWFWQIAENLSQAKSTTTLKDTLKQLGQINAQAQSPPPKT